MDPFYAFIIFVVLLALEMLAGQSWAAVYYRFGIPVYRSRRAMRGSALTVALDKYLQERFKNRPALPALRFRLLPKHGQESAGVAFHESLFDARGGPRYFPVMHSLARVDPVHGEVQVTGWLNGYVVFLLFYLVYASITERGFLFVAMLVAFLFVLSYFAQIEVNRAVAEEIRAAGRAV